MGWQRSQGGPMPAELTGNPPSWVLGEAIVWEAPWNSPQSHLYGMPGGNIRGEVPPWQHCTAESPERMLQDTADRWVLLTSAHWGAKCWRSHLRCRRKAQDKPGTLQEAGIGEATCAAGAWQALHTESGREAASACIVSPHPSWQSWQRRNIYKVHSHDCKAGNEGWIWSWKAIGW